MIKLVRAGALLPVLLAVLLGAVSGCGASDEVELVPVVLPRQGSLRVVNAIPDASAIDAFINSAPVARPNFAESSPLAESLVGRYVLNIVYTPPSDVTTTLVDNELVDLTDQDEYSFVMIGPIATTRLLRVKNVEITFGANTTTPALFPPPDYQIVHAATSVGSVDVYVTPDSADLANATPAATVTFGDVTPLTKLDKAVTYRIRVTPVGSKTPVLFDSGAYSVDSFIRSMYLLLDNFGPGGEALRVANINAIGAQDFVNQTLASALRVANLIPDLPLVDVYLDGTRIFQAAYGVTTGYETVPNGNATLTITPPNDPGKVVATGSVTFVGGQARSLYTSRLAPSTAASVNVVADSQRSIAGQAQLQFVAAAPTAGSVDVYALVPGQPISDARPILANAPLLASNSTNLSQGSYDVIVTRAGSSVELFGPERISVDAGGIYTAVLLDAAGGGTPLQLEVSEEILP